jgi:hypothetical protein
MRRVGQAGLCAAFAAAVSLATGCASRFPSVHGTSDARFAAGGAGVTRIDVLPLNVAVSAWEGAEVAPDQIQASFDAAARLGIAESLARRGYGVAAQIDWQGRFLSEDGEDLAALTADELQETAEALSTYGMVQASRRDGALVAPFLPARLGEATGAEATLYVGGYAYHGKDPKGSTAGKVAKVVLIAALIVVVVVVIAVAAKNGGGGGGGAVGGVARAAGGAARVVGRSAMGVGRIALRTTASAVRVAPRLTARGADVTLRTLDAFSRSGTHLELYYTEDDHRPPAAPTAGRSQMMLEMTLIDNRTGYALWHARQTFRANPANPADVRRAMRTMLQAMPRHP